MERSVLSFVAVLGAMILFLCPVSYGDVPHMINYQGKLTTASGGCLNDTVQMTFTIYADEEGSIVEWAETQEEVVVKEGIFNVLLGSINHIPGGDTLFDGSIKYLGVQVEPDPEMRPLKPMVSMGYAFHSGTADTAFNVAPNGLISVDGVSNPGGDVDFVAGTNMTITPNPQEKNITFSALGASTGWVDDGTSVRLETSTDYVGIGTTSPTRKLDVNGTGYFSGDLRIDGNLGVHTDPVPEGKESKNNIFLYDGGTYSGPYIKVSGHNEAALQLESRRVSVTSGNNWTIQSGGGTETYLDQFVIGNPDDGGCFYIRDGGRVGIGEKWPQNRLDVKGEVAVGTGYSGSSSAPTDGMIVEGNVGIGTTSPQGALDVSSTTGAFIVPRMTAAQRDVLTAVNGMIIYNTTTNQFNFYENGAWITK